jgi:hypothetical protein
MVLHASGLSLYIEDLAIMSLERQVVCTCQACRACTNSHAFIAVCVLSAVLIEVLLSLDPSHITAFEMINEAMPIEIIV